MASELKDEPTRENPCGPIGSAVVFENGQVRIWEMNVPAGQRKEWHHHKLPYIIVAMTGGTIEIESVEGNVVRPAEKIGDVMWRDPGEKHELRNLGDTVYRNVLIELKNGK